MVSTLPFISKSVGVEIISSMNVKVWWKEIKSPVDRTLVQTLSTQWISVGWTLMKKYPDVN